MKTDEIGFGFVGSVSRFHQSCTDRRRTYSTPCLQMPRGSPSRRSPQPLHPPRCHGRGAAAKVAKSRSPGAPLLRRRRAALHPRIRLTALPPPPKELPQSQEKLLRRPPRGRVVATREVRVRRRGRASRDGAMGHNLRHRIQERIGFST
jgi:hypothetical protein